MSQRPETKAIRIQTPKTGEKEHATPLFLTSSFTYNSAEEMAAAFADDTLDVNIYSRFSNPTVDEFITMAALKERRMALLPALVWPLSFYFDFLPDHIIASAVFDHTYDTDSIWPKGNRV
jgi:O-succinylhomoserine sulfhydrylase